MACFIVPAAEAMVTTIVTQVVKKSEAKTCVETHEEPHLKLSRKLGWLNMMLWGGALLLAFEHIWHGEIVPWYPFFTKDPSQILHEMSTVGVAMAVTVTAVWAVMAAVTSAIEKRKADVPKEDPS